MGVDFCELDWEDDADFLLDWEEDWDVFCFFAAGVCFFPLIPFFFFFP